MGVRMLAKEGLMSFRTSSTESGRAFERVRRSLLQGDELPFADVLTAAHLAEVFDAEGVDLPEADDPDVVYTPATTLWAFLSQMLFTGEQRSCQAAVARVAAAEALHGRVVSDTNTGAYCRARRRIPETVPRRLTLEMAADCETQVPVEWLTLTHTQRWHAHHHTTGTGHLYQGRFKSFPVQSDEHFLTVCRYVERNALRANLVKRAEDWLWNSLWHRQRPRGCSAAQTE